MINKKVIDFRIEPYLQEATLQIVIDIVIIALLIVVFAVAKFSLAICAFIVFGYFVIAIVLHYRLLIQALVDKHKGDLITETVGIKRFYEEYSFAGDYLGHSYICKFYPKEMQVQKYRIRVINTHGEEKNLRSVMSFRRLLDFSILDNQQIKHLQIVYLKRSKIFISCNLVEDVDNNYNRKKKETIKKAVSFINKAV